MEPTKVCEKPTVHSVLEAIEKYVSRIEDRLFPVMPKESDGSQPQPALDATISRLCVVNKRLELIDEELMKL